MARCNIRGRRKVREGCKNVGRRGGFEEGPKRCFSRGRHIGVLSEIAVCEATDAEPVGMLQILDSGSVALRVSFRVAVAGIRMPGPTFFMAGAVL